MKKKLAMLLAAAMVLGSFAACSSSSDDAQTDDSAVETEAADGAEEEEAGEPLAETIIYLDAAASMQNAFEEIIDMYKEVQPNVTVTGNYDSSGTLLTQIEESNGIDHDIFFSAGKKQVTTLDETDGLVVEGTVNDLLGNALVLATYKDSDTEVTGWDDMDKASSFALCDGTVPVGQYTRKLLVSKGLLAEVEDPNVYTSEEVSAALGGIEINECANVTAAATAVAEGSNEIGTMYYTDYYAFQDQLTIIASDEKGEFTGEIIYPVCQVNNSEADDAELAATKDFLAFIQSDEVLEVFEKYCFIVR